MYGIPRIAKTNSVVVKLVWIIMLLISVSYGFYTISRSINNFNQFDVITNVERIYPKSVTFPAITIRKKDYFKMLIRLKIHFYVNNKSIHSILPDIKLKDKSIDVRNENNGIDFFKILKSFGDCVRFNGPTIKDFKTCESKTDAFFRTCYLIVLKSVSIRKLKKSITVQFLSYYRIGGLEECGGVLQAHQVIW